VLTRFFPDHPVAQFFGGQLTHVSWAGFHFYDLIFPLFVFLSGMSLAFSLERFMAAGDTRGAMVRLVQRGAVLFLLGVFFNAGLRDGFEKIRWLGVLQRIAITTTATGLLALVFRPRTLAAAGLALWSVYGGLLLFFPVPSTGHTGFEEGMNLTNWFDQTFLPGRKHDGTHDPEGILSSIPAIVSALCGYLAGRWMRSSPADTRLRPLIIVGVVCIGLAWTMHPWVPIIKKLWTPSFVLVTTGWSLLFLAAFSRIFDERTQPAWSAPLRWVGSNPIILYLLSGLGLFRSVAERLCGKNDQPLGWLQPLVAFGVMLLFARWLHRRQILLRV
jgi:predicted acyltransferase